jgi:translation initiation factor 2 beta subunit (eIF-2beta)/eIF-5
MAARGDRPPSDQSFAENAIILEALERDPDHVLRVLAQIAERLKADGRYTAEEVEAAAMYLCRELGIRRSVN